MALPRIAILASGSGTTTESFIRSALNKEIGGEVVLVICSNQNAGVFERVKRLNSEYGLNIKMMHIGKSNFGPEPGESVEYGRQTTAEERAILKALEDTRASLVLLLGYMKLVGKSIVDKYGWRDDYASIYQTRMINTHPGLLPETKSLYGIHVQEKALKDKLGRAGHCLFAVDSEYDDGPVISEHTVKVLDNDTPEQLFERVKDSEKQHLARDINDFITGQKKYMGLQ